MDTDNRKDGMKRELTALTATLLISSCLLGVTYSAFAAGGSRSIVLFRYQRLHEADQWIISEDRILETPTWDINVASIPVAPEKAWRIAKDSLAKQGFSQPQLVKIEIRPFVPESESTQLNPAVRQRFYYGIQCSPAPHIEGKPFDLAYIFILMDGSILEPKVTTHF